MNELCTLIARHCHRTLTPTAVPRLTLSRSNVTTELSTAMYCPLLCVVARGRKRIFLGHEEFCYDPNSYLVASADLPVSGQVLEAPCLGITLTLEPATLAALLLEMPPADGEHAASKAMAVNPLDADLLDPLLRLLRLLDRPGDIPRAGADHRKGNPVPPAARAARQDAPANDAAQQSVVADQSSHPPDSPMLPREDTCGGVGPGREYERHVFSPAFPRRDGHESAPVPEAHPFTGSAPPSACRGRGRGPNQLRRGLRKRVSI